MKIWNRVNSEPILQVSQFGAGRDAMNFNPKALLVTAIGTAILALGLSGVRSVDVSIRVAMWIAVVVLSIAAVRSEVRGSRQKSKLQ
jgi:hypothetical protein